MIWLYLALAIAVLAMVLPEAKTPPEAGECDWCKADWEVCGTCRKYFSLDDGCAADPKECGCTYYEPFGYCPKCGRKLRDRK